MENLEAKGTQATHLPVAEPLQVAIPTQNTEDWLPLGWVAPQLGQGSSVLTDSGKFLWRRRPWISGALASASVSRLPGQFPLCPRCHLVQGA